MASQVSSLAVVRNRRIVLVVALAAAAAAAAVVGVTLLQTRGQRTSFPVQPGRPPLELELGLRSDGEAQALVRAEQLLNKGAATQAAAIFARYHSFAAQLGAAFAGWRGPASLGTVQALAAAHPRDPAALLDLGWAYYWAGRDDEAVTAWQQTARRYPDSPYGVDAQDALHPADHAGLPYLVLGFQAPPAVRKLPAAQEVAALARAANRPDARAKLLYGAALWNDLKRPRSAEREFEAAARLAPTDPVARTAAAVGAFTKADPVKAFGRLGPLTAVFPQILGRPLPPGPPSALDRRTEEGGRAAAARGCGRPAHGLRGIRRCRARPVGERWAVSKEDLSRTAHAPRVAA